MKKLLFMLLLAMSGQLVQARQPSQTASPRSSTASDSLRLDALMAMDKQQFIGKTVAEFLASQEAKAHEGISFRTNQEEELEAIRIKYSSSLYLHLYLLKSARLEKQRENSREAGWDIESLKEELIDQIRVVYVMHEGIAE